MSYSSLSHSGMTRVNEVSHGFTCHSHVYPQAEWEIPAFTPQLQSISRLWLVLISHPAEGRRLSWPGWLGETLRWFACPIPVVSTVARNQTRNHWVASTEPVIGAVDNAGHSVMHWKSCMQWWLFVPIQLLWAQVVYCFVRKQDCGFIVDTNMTIKIMACLYTPLQNCRKFYGCWLKADWWRCILHTVVYGLKTYLNPNLPHSMYPMFI